MKIVSVFLIIATLTTASWAGDNWISCSESGCKVWNPAPAVDETVTWIGTEKDGKAHGFGIAIWAVKGKESERTSGEWTDGKVQGYAVWVHQLGHRYEGSWNAGERQGYGTYRWPDGRSFSGAFQQNKRTEGRTFDRGGEPVTLIPAKGARAAVFEAQDAAIAARKAATRAQLIADRIVKRRASTDTPETMEKNTAKPTAPAATACKQEQPAKATCSGKAMCSGQCAAKGTDKCSGACKATCKGKDTCAAQCKVACKGKAAAPGTCKVACKDKSECAKTGSKSCCGTCATKAPVQPPVPDAEDAKPAAKRKAAPAKKQK